MTFDTRRRQARTFEDRLFATLTAMGFMVAQNGTEHTHPRFVQALRDSTDQTSLALRFQPDGVGALGAAPHTFYIEAKNGKTIERAAYQQYMKLHAAGHIVVVVFGEWQPWRWGFVEELPLIPGSESVRRFAPARRFPLDAEEWLCPRVVGGRAGAGSGTPYKEVRGTGLREWVSFKRDVAQRLFEP